MTGNKDILRWYAVHTNSRHEEQVNIRLQHKDISVFLPMVEVWSKRKDRKKRIRVPLFKGYLFIHVVLDASTRLNVIKTPGIARIVGNIGEPIPIPDAEINSIRILLNNDLMLTPMPYLKVGQKVRIVNGPLAGVEGILIETHPNKNKLVVNVDLLQRSLYVELTDIDVEPVI